MREFNLRDESDPNYVPDMLEVNDEIEALIYQIKMPLGTNQGEVLGEPDFGCDMDGVLFSTEFYMVSVDKILTDQVTQYSELAQIYPVTIVMQQVSASKYRNAILLDVKINGISTFGALMK